ncbi:MAG: hypothetical protein AAFN70_00640 [Planctomycetota bacterium]
MPLAIVFIFTFAAQAVGSQPLFPNSIVSTDIDFIQATDPSDFLSLRFVNRARKEMPDKRSDGLFVDDAFVFEATFRGDKHVQIYLHADFKTQAQANRYASMLTGPLGRLPPCMRRNLSHVVVHKGDETAFGESEGHFFVLYSKNMETRVRNHDLEETVFHESVHATLDAQHSRSKAWRTAQRTDDSFITAYAASKPTREDMAESAIFAYTLLKHPGRMPKKVEQAVRERMPNRLAFFRTIFSR